MTNIIIHALRNIDKNIRKILGKSLRNHEFYNFEKQINVASKQLFKNFYKSSLNKLKTGTAIDPRYRDFHNKIINEFKDCYIIENVKLFFYKPSLKDATGTYSAFKNIMEGLSHIGINNTFFSSRQELINEVDNVQKSFIFIEKEHLEKEFNLSNKGLNTYIGIAIHPNSNKNYEDEIIDLFNKEKIHFCFSFSCTEYITETYKKIIKNGIPIFDMEFGANPKVHFPIKTDCNKIDYIFLGSTNRRKWDRYFLYFNKIFENHTGFISGPGWTDFYIKNKPFDVDRILYSNSKVGLNLSVPSQLEKPRELNERTYQLAACGIVQLIDNPTLLHHRFPEDAIISAKNPEEYYKKFSQIINNEINIEPIIKSAYMTVMNNHTIYHRALKLGKHLNSSLIKEKQ